MPIKIRSRSPVFELVRDLYVINTWFKFEGKIQNTSEVIVFTRNHTDDDVDAEGRGKMQIPTYIKKVLF